MPILTIPSAQPQGRVASSLLLHHVARLGVDRHNGGCQCLAAGCTIARSIQDAVQLGRRLLEKPAYLREMGDCLHEAAARGIGIFDYAYWTAKALSGSRLAYETTVIEKSGSFHVIVSH